VIGIVLIALGLAQAAVAVTAREDLANWTLLLVFGIVTIIVGIAAISWPNATIRVIALLFGIRLIVIALGMISVGMTFRKLGPSSIR
ncbi:MAG: DUF308 domain-containing protein, partial [Microthrixaceae bacterium]